MMPLPVALSVIDKFDTVHYLIMHSLGTGLGVMHYDSYAVRYGSRFMTFVTPPEL